MLYYYVEKLTMKNENLESQTREVSDFDGIILKSYGELFVTQGDRESLTIDAHPNIFPTISTTVKNGKLILKMSAKSWWERLKLFVNNDFYIHKIVFRVVAKNLNTLTISGAGRVSASEIKTGRLSIDVSGAAVVLIHSLDAEILEVNLTGVGSVQTSGKVKQQHVTISGAGSYRGADLESQKANVINSGTGNTTIWATEELEARVSGVGNVTYYGSPKVKYKVSGVGKISSIGDMPRNE